MVACDPGACAHDPNIRIELDRGGSRRTDIDLAYPGHSVRRLWSWRIDSGLDRDRRGFDVDAPSAGERQTGGDDGGLSRRMCQSGLRESFCRTQRVRISGISTRLFEMQADEWYESPAMQLGDVSRAMGGACA